MKVKEEERVGHAPNSRISCSYYGLLRRYVVQPSCSESIFVQYAGRKIFYPRESYHGPAAADALEIFCNGVKICPMPVITINTENNTLWPCQHAWQTLKTKLVTHITTGLTLPISFRE